MPATAEQTHMLHEPTLLELVARVLGLEPEEVTIRSAVPAEPDGFSIRAEHDGVTSYLFISGEAYYEAVL